MAHDVPMSQVRVLLLSNAITPDRPGGLQRYVRDLATALARGGADVMIHARRVNQEDPERCVDVDGVEIWRFRTPSKDHALYALGYPAASSQAVRSAVRAAHGTRVLHSHYPLQGLPLALGSTPYVHTFHAPVYREMLPEHQDAYALPGPTRAAAVSLMRLGESRVVRRAHDVVVLSEFMRQEAIALGAAPGSISLLRGGIDTERFAPGAPVAHPWAEADGPLLFTARRMVPRTGVGELVEAFARISTAVPDARLVLAGRGPLEQDIRELVRELGLDERVRMLGWISDEELVGWYRAADLVVMPTQELEGFGLTSAEALACGTAVVATPAGANPEVLGRLDASLIARDTSPAAIAEAAIELLREPQRLAALSARARAAVHPDLSWGAVADGYLALYERHQSEAGNGRHPSGNGRHPSGNGRHPSAAAPAPTASEPSAELVSLLRAPGLGAELHLEGGMLLTADGQERFPLVGRVPILLAADSPFSPEGYQAGEPGPAPLARRLRTAVRGAAPSLSHNLSAARNFTRFRDLLHAHAERRARVLVVGGAILGEGMAVLAGDPDIGLVEADVAIGPRTDVICDAHTLPFADHAFDGVVCQAVLEHVADPPRVVGEIHRVLKPGGLVYSEIPFMQQVHEGAYDFTRYTYNGHRRLFRRFEEIDAGATAGPGMALGWSIRSLLVASVGARPGARGLVNVLSTLGFFWLKYLDRPLMAGGAALDGASGTYFLGRSREGARTDGEIIAGYRGANSGFSVRR
jgi:glycosyltransferase involved in cell wall biosynthesis/SAM-dependent methyltransferase